MLFFILFITQLYFGISFFSLSPGKQRHPSLWMSNKYTLSNEYINFFRKFKGPFIQSSNSEENYDYFIEKNIKSYKLFEKNYLKINETNNLLKLQNNSFRLEINKYADTVDLDSSQANDLMNKPISDNIFRPTAYLKVIQSPFPYLENIINQNKYLNFSWSNTKMLSPVKHQGRCGSCWAFASTSALETFMRINNYNVSRLSEQELVDCSKENYGCNGGLMHLAFDYIIKNGGLSSNNQYEYKAKTHNCSSKGKIKHPGSHLSEYEFTIPKSITDMKIHLIQTPITIAIDANNMFFRFYKEGVIDLHQKRNGTLNHAVLLVGFEHDEKGMYWIIQNSWGDDWGDNGFCKIRAEPGEGVLLCQMYGVYPTKIFNPYNLANNYQI